MPRSKEKFEEIREKSKNNILQAAIKLFSSKGYHATSTNAIAKEAGVASGLMYNYFNSKEALLVSIIDQYFNELIDSLSNRFKDSNQPPDAGKIIDAVIEQICIGEQRWKLLISIMFQPGISETCQKQMESFFLHQWDLFEIHFKTQKVSNPEKSAKVLWAVIHGALLNYASNNDLETLLLVRRTVIEQIVQKGI